MSLQITAAIFALVMIVGFEPRNFTALIFGLLALFALAGGLLASL